MSILGLLKGVFAEKKKEPELIVAPKQEIISIPNIESWFAAKEADIIKNAELVIKEKCPSIQASMQNCEIALAALRAAGPRYPQLYEPNKNIANGNRLAFVITAENFLKSIKLPNSPSLLHDFILEFEANMTNFMVNSNRSFVISNEFFTDQTIAVKSNLQELDKLMQEIKCFCQKNKLAELKKAKEDITKLIKKVQQGQQLKDESREVEGRLAGLLREKDKVKIEQSSFFQSPQLAEKQKLESDLTEIRVQVKAKEDELYSTFGTLDTPLRKLAWENPKLKKHINNYLNNLIGAVLDDKDFAFREMLIKLRCAIEANEIELKDKKRAQAIKDINLLTDSFVQIWRDIYKGLKAKEDELKAKLETSDVAKKESELKAQLQILEVEQESLNKQKGTLVNKLNKVTLDKDLEEISHKLSALLGSTVKISN